MVSQSVLRRSATAALTLGLLAMAGVNPVLATSQQQPPPNGQFHEPAPPVPAPDPSPKIDPATGFAIDSYTGYLIHPPTGYLIEPTTGYLLLPGSLIYTNLLYNKTTGEVTEVDHQAPASPEPTPTPKPSATPTPTASETPAPATPSAPAPTVEAPVPSTSPTPTETPTSRPTPSASPEAVEAELASSRAPLVWAVGALVLLAAIATIVVGVRRRRAGS
ncbi:hypothetical protein [Arthrobacter zhaoguopingii]|uniref:hypothetical protein n=1 Tax=Arthrobacter zhaoguopingii TaxID=2681491 RepID=UPI0013570FF4|nr:hypothetical protein [Arthrobacter zhaoguopingii]